MESDRSSDEEILQNYLSLKEAVKLGLDKAGKANDLREAKGYLIEVQSHFKGLRLRREDREELYTKLQKAFAEVNAKIEDEKLEFEYEALANYSDLKSAVKEAVARTESSNEFRETWDLLLQVQNRIKGAKLLREHRDELFTGLQDAFTLIKSRREDEKRVFENEAQTNYTRLKALVEKGLIQAEETHEYKDTREFLKKIQAEFKGTRLIHEQREELYSRLQTAFDILGKRLDDFFHNKKKNWEVKMQFKLSQFSVDIFELQEALVKDRDYLKELEDQLEIILSSKRDSPVKIGLEARIGSTKRSIERKEKQIAAIEIERNELLARMEQPQE